MEVGLYQSASAMDSFQKWQTAISQNLASASSAGFKKQIVAQESVSRGNIGSFESQLQASLPVNRTKSSLQDGRLIPTEKPTDIAIQGEGFFQVESPNGQLVLTRNGEFFPNNAGLLVNNKGQLLQGTGGPINVNQGTGPLIITQAGDIFRGDAQIGSIPVVNVQNPDILQAVHGGFIIPPTAAVTAEPIDQPNILQGFTESSNVSPVLEMVNLIQVSQAHENNLKVISSIDTRLERAIQTLADTK